MELKQYNIEPTDENILASLHRNTAGRNSALSPFLEIIDHDLVSTLALNGDWGSGKTFFIKQAILLLNYLDPNSSLDPDVRTAIRDILQNQKNGLTPPVLYAPYRAVYYNAWLYDDHNDPIQSLLYFLSVTFGRDYGIRDPEAAKLFAGVVTTLTKWKGADLDTLVPSLSSTDLLAEVRTMEDVKQAMQEAFHDLLGDAYSLVVFVDELDRCSPMYAVRFLERVKHFFDCPKVKFVFATNLRQLGATIQNFYGASFDSTKYLNKFFDFTVELPPVSMKQYLQTQVYLLGTKIFNDFCVHLCSFFHFSLRDLNKFLGVADKLNGRISGLVQSFSKNSNANAFAYLFFPPLLAALSIYDQEASARVIAGQEEELVLAVFDAWTDGISFAQMTLPNLTDTTPHAIRVSIADLYRNIFSVGPKHSQFDPQDIRKNTILSISSNLY